MALIMLTTCFLLACIYVVFGSNIVNVKAESYANTYYVSVGESFSIKTNEVDVRSECLIENTALATVSDGDVNLVNGAWQYSCTVTGVSEGTTALKVYYTSRDNGSWTDTIEAIYKIVVCNHSYIDSIVTKKPTCSEYGVKLFSCTKCGGTKTENIDKDVNNHVEATKTILKTEPTCTESGYSGDVVCAGCGMVYSNGEIFEPLGHDWEEEYTIDKPATYIEAGSKSIHCSRCAEKKDVAEIPSLIFNDGTITTNVSGNCDKVYIVNGSETITGKTMNQDIYVPKNSVLTFSGENRLTGNLYIFGTVTNMGTLNVTGTMYCLHYGNLLSAGSQYDYGYLNNSSKISGGTLVCNTSYLSLAIPTLSHKTIANYAQVNPTCTERGQSSYSVCLECNTQISKPKIIEAIGHKKGEAIKENIVDATCTQDGSYDEVIKCKQCGDELSRTPKVIHASHTLRHAVLENKKPATCTQNGSHDEVVYCAVCNDEIKREKVVVSATGHTKESLIENLIKATSKNEGSYDLVIRCTSCGEVISREKKIIPMTSVAEHGDASNSGAESNGLSVVKKPGKVKIKSATNVKGKKVAVIWMKIAGSKGYQIRYSTNKKMKKSKSKKTTKEIYTIKGLKKKTYFIRVRAYNLKYNNKVYGAWSKTMKVRVKK